MTDALLSDFKSAMRRLAATVTIITTGTGENWTGMAATAVSSVTADPPTLLIAVNQSASIASMLKMQELFCVNLLAERHAPLVEIFSGQKRGLERFEGGRWISSDEGLPLLSDALASLVCKTMTVLDVATHTVFIGIVQKAHSHPVIDPLIWADGGFGKVHALT